MYKQAMCSNSYVVRFQQNVPCNLTAVIIFLFLFVLLDHIRGLMCVIAILIFMHVFNNKNEHYPGRHNSLSLCTSNEGVHLSCAMTYGTCCTWGIAECLSLTVHPESGPTFLQFPVFVGFLIAMWLGVIAVSILFVDSARTTMRFAHAYTHTYYGQEQLLHGDGDEEAPVTRTVAGQKSNAAVRAKEAITMAPASHE